MEHALGSRIRAHRKAAGMTASRLAHEAGVTEDAIRKIESGRSKQPSFTTGVQIARALGVSPFILAVGDAADAQPAPTQLNVLARAIAALREKRGELEAIGVQHAAVFGSVARGDDDEDSDIDILIDLSAEASETFSLLDLSHVGIIMGDYLERQVDVISKRNVERQPRLHGILSEAVYAF